MTKINDTVAMQVEELTNVLYDLNPTTANALVTGHDNTYQEIAATLRMGRLVQPTRERAELIDDLILAINAHGGQRPLSKKTLSSEPKGVTTTMNLSRRLLAPLAAIFLIVVLAACQSASPPPSEQTEKRVDDIAALLDETANPQLAFVQNENMAPQNMADGAHAVAWLSATEATSERAVPYTPDARYSYNFRIDEDPFSGTTNSYPAAQNTVTRLADGLYMATLPNFNVFGGTVHVTAIGSASHCKILYWFPSGANLTVYVLCFDSDGNLANSRFSLLYYKNAKELPSHGLAYVWSHDPNAERYVPHWAYQYNSRRVSNFVTRLAQGRYRVTFNSMQGAAGEQTKAGHVQVTAYGGDSTHCKVVSWGPLGNSIVADISCYDHRGALADSRFTASFMREPGRLAVRLDANPFSTRRGHYLWAHAPSLSAGSAYTPNALYRSYESPSAAASRVTRTATGAYTVFIPNLKVAPFTNIQVTAQGNDAARCNIRTWWGFSDRTTITVACHDSSGNRVDSRFKLHYITEGS